MQLIGLAGKAGSGKSYLAEQLLVPEGFLPLALAGPMKAELAGQGVIPGEEALGLTSKSARTRNILQTYGTELGRERYHEDVWCSTLEWWIGWFLSHAYERFVITDVRYPNELEWVRSLGGLVVRVVGRGGLEGDAAAHSSEVALDSFNLPELDNSEGRELIEIKQDLISLVSNHYRSHEPQLDEEYDEEFASSYEGRLRETLDG